MHVLELGASHQLRSALEDKLSLPPPKEKKVLEFEVEVLEIRVGVSEGGKGVNGIRVMLDICRHHGYD
jgi:hypothetical protein